MSPVTRRALLALASLPREWAPAQERPSLPPDRVPPITGDWRIEEPGDERTPLRISQAVLERLGSFDGYFLAGIPGRGEHKGLFDLKRNLFQVVLPRTVNDRLAMVEYSGYLRGTDEQELTGTARVMRAQPGLNRGAGGDLPWAFRWVRDKRK